jgi:hypothetical protein
MSGFASPQLELAIAASAAREWLTANTTHVVRWLFYVARKRLTHEHHRWPSREPAARPSVAPQRGADGSPSTGNGGHHPLRPTSPLVRPSPSSQEELRKLIKTEVASRLVPYERLLEEAKTATAGKDAEMASLKGGLAKVKAQQESSAAPAAEPASPTDPKCQPGTHDWTRRHLQRESRPLRQEAREATHLCNGKCHYMKEKQFRMSTELVLQEQEIVVLQKRLKEEQQLTREWRCASPSPQAGRAHSLSGPL